MVKYICFAIMSIPTVLFAQFDVCDQLGNILKSAYGNFNDIRQIAYHTKGGEVAYTTSFTCVEGKEAFVYRDAAGNNPEFYQNVSTLVSDYTKWYTAVEACLFHNAFKWYKTESGSATGVIFTNEAKGVDIMVLTGNAGVSIKVSQDPAMSIPALADDFCVNLLLLAHECATGFVNLRKEQTDSSILGIEYRIDIDLNPKNTVVNSVTIGSDIFDPNKGEYRFTELFKSNDISFTALLEAAEQCLNTEANTWTKMQQTDRKVIFQDGRTKITLSEELPDDAREPSSIFLQMINL